MKSKIFKINLRMIMVILIFFTISLTACNCDGDTIETTPSENSGGDGDSGSNGSVADYELGSGGIDGVEGTLGDESISISESNTESSVTVFELGSTDPNNIYDENDHALQIAVYKDSGSEKIYIRITKYGYTEYETNEIYEYNSNSDTWGAIVEYCQGNCDGDEGTDWLSYIPESINLFFSEFAEAVGSTIKGEVSVTLDDGNILLAEFETTLGVYVYQYQ